MRSAGFALAILAASRVAAAECDVGRVDLFWQDNQVAFSVEVADDVPERARGLMHRPHMEPDHGMLFVYDSPRAVSFWMKNTEIPLDMLFAGADGRVRTIRHRATPLDETPIPGGEQIQYVLEINGGRALELGIPEGAALSHPAIAGPDVAVTCDGS